MMGGINLADGHLTYRKGEGKVAGRYGVYPRGGVKQIGWVYRLNSGTWVADTTHEVWRCDGSWVPERTAKGQTRWEAATQIWAPS